jgi:hypothetical protein
MITTAITPSIAVTIGQQTRLYHAFVTTAPAVLDAPSTMTLYAATLEDVFGLAADPIAVNTSQASTRARLVLVDATELKWQRASYCDKRHIFAAADPVLVGLNGLQHWLWQRLRAPITDTCAQQTEERSA